jgi:hypothetical protein
MMTDVDVLARLKQRMLRDADGVPVTLTVPPSVFQQLSEIARERGFVDAHTLLRYYVTQGIRADVHAREVQEERTACPTLPGMRKLEMG